MKTAWKAAAILILLTGLLRADETKYAVLSRDSDYITLSKEEDPNHSARVGLEKGDCFKFIGWKDSVFAILEFDGIQFKAIWDRVKIHNSTPEMEELYKSTHQKILKRLDVTLARQAKQEQKDEIDRQRKAEDDKRTLEFMEFRAEQEAAKKQQINEDWDRMQRSTRDSNVDFRLQQLEQQRIHDKFHSHNR